MREIKFRAWDTNINVMYSMKQLLLRWNTLSILTCPYFKIMQYTGLKDKNGTEIYEGDIVKFGEDEVFYEVYQHDSGSWDARGLSLWEWISENGNENEWEVIGNIYENQELLEGRE